MTKQQTKYSTPLPDPGQLFIEPAVDEIQFCPMRMIPIVSNAVLKMEQANDKLSEE